MKSYEIISKYKRIIIVVALIIGITVSIGIVNTIQEEQSVEYTAIANLGNNRVMENYFWSAINVTTSGMLLGTSKLATALGNSSESGKIINLGKFREIMKKRELKSNFKSDLQRVTFTLIF